MDEIGTMSASDDLEDQAAVWRDWLDEQSEAQAALDIELDEVDLASFGLAALEQTVDKGLDWIAARSPKERRPRERNRRSRPPARRRAPAPCRGSRRSPGACWVPHGRVRDAERQPRGSGQGDRRLALRAPRDRAWHKMIEERKCRAGDGSDRHRAGAAQDPGSN